MNIVRIVFGVVGIVWLVGVMAFGAGMSWLQHDPEAAAGVALGAMAVDGDAGVMENAQAFAGGYSAGSGLVAAAQEAEANNDLRENCEAEADSDWGAPAHCDAIAEADRETYERLADEW